MFKNVLPVFMIMALACSASAEELQPIKLAPPQLSGGKTLMQALKDRKSERAFSTKPIPADVLSNLLWAACGINRPETGKRTAPSAMNRQEIDVFVALPTGVYRYHPQGHMLMPVSSQDIRALTGTQAFAGQAPLNLIYVADMSRLGGEDLEDRILYAAADTGFISQNVYLYSASAGLATVVRGSIDREALAKALKLHARQKIILAQSVGYAPK